MKRLTTLLAAAGAALGLCGAAHADMSGMVGNTVVLAGGDNTIKVQLHADGTYQTSLSNGTTVKGTWADNGGQLCYTQTDPAPPAGRPNPFCVPGMDGKKVGDTWSQPGPGGATMNGSVVAGQ
jgi:hypothetical protein